jgi:KRAB domain-containing zinc finger protein
LKKRNYHKFKKGNCVYIVKDDWREKEYLKFGKTGNINDRLQDYRTFAPECKILFLVYLENNELLENCIKSKYENILTHLNHECLLNIESEKLSKVIIQLIKFLNMEATIDNTLDFYNNPYENIDNNKIKNNEDSKNITEIKNNEENDTNLEEEEEEDKIVKKEIKDYECELCDKVYKLEGNLKNHIIKVHNIGEKIDDNNTCKICNAVLSNKGKLNRHIETVHNKSNVIKCDICKKEYNSKDALNSHIKQVHEKSLSVKCPQCDGTFTSNGNLRIHIQNVHEKNTQQECKICHKILTTKSNLITHIKRKHEKVTKIKCTICLQELASKGGYEYHMSKMHKIIL